MTENVIPRRATLLDRLHQVGEALSLGRAEVTRRTVLCLLVSVLAIGGLVAPAHAAVAWGTALGSYNGVTAYSNGFTHDINGPLSTYGYQYQCVEYVNRYYVLVLGHKNMRGTGHAKDYYGSASSRGLTAYPNGGTTAPRPGDLLCSNGGDYGHVAIVREVGSDYIKVIQQNWFNDSRDASMRLSMSVSGGKYTVSGFNSSYPIKGWLRKPGSTTYPYATNLTVTQSGKGTEAVNRFSFTIKNNTSKTVVFERLKVDIRQSAAGKKGGTQTVFDIPGENNVSLAPGATLTRNWYKAIPRDGTYATNVAVMVGGSWQGDTQMSANRKKTITVTYGPKGDLNSDGDADFTTVKRAFTTDQQRLTFHNFLSDTANKKWVASTGLDYWTTNKDFDYLKYGKYVIGNFTADGRTDICALYDNRDGTCTIRVYGSDGTKYATNSVWFTTGGWRYEASKPIAADVDGDGDDDLVIIYNTSSGGTYSVSANVFLSNGAKFSYGGTYLTLSSPTFDYFNRCEFTAADIHGLGKESLIVLSDAGSSTSRVTGYSLSPSGGAQVFTTLLPYEHARLRLLAGDVDNDTREDVVLVYRGSASGAQDAISFITLLAKESYATPRFWLDARGASHWDNGKFVCGDFNGDGRDDIAAAYGGDGYTTFRLYPSTGTAFGYTSYWNLTQQSYTFSTYHALNRNREFKTYDSGGGSSPTGTVIQHDEGGVTFDRFVTGHSSAYSGGGYVYGRWTGTELQVRFTGNKIRWIGPKQPGYGKADIYIDGTKVGTADAYASEAQKTQSAVVWQSGTLSDGAHTMTIKLTGEKNVASTGNVVVVDRFEVDGSAAAPGALRFDERGSYATFGGPWITGKNSAYIGGGYEYSRHNTASYKATFNGTKVGWIGPRTGNYGRAEVLIDGVRQGVVSQYGPTGWRYRVWESKVLPRGQHTIEIRPTGTKDAASKGTIVVIDAIDVVP